MNRKLVGKEKTRSQESRFSSRSGNTTASRDSRLTVNVETETLDETDEERRNF